ncbi:hypothetical protein ACFQZR_19580 [Paenibacillus sp. GCM10027629]|uniref:hypothetical protein n=1 Tax=Paenibacillus sp. GCM10027629 TaxID=3273414 RepID=UPI0036449FD1
MDERIVYIGYHGTSNSAAEQIDKGNFRVTHDRAGWLGSGVYFYQENIENAKYWAKRKFVNKGRLGGLLRVELILPKELVFDVTDPLGESNKFYQAVRKRFVEDEIKKNKLTVKVSNQDDLDGKVFNLICIKNGYRMVRGCTITPDDNDREYRLQPHTPNGVELCLRDTRYISTKEKLCLDGSV